MSANEATWDFAQDAPPAVSAPEGEQPSTDENVQLEVPEVEPTPEAQLTAPVEPSDDAARVAEAPTQEPTPLEQEEKAREEKEGPNWAIKAYRKQVETIKTLERDAEPIRLWLDPTIPVSKANDRFSELSPSRYAEAATDIYNQHRETFLKRDFGLEVPEGQSAADVIKSALQDADKYRALEHPTLPTTDGDQLAYAREILADETNLYSAQDKAMAAQFVQMQEKLGKLPNIEERLNTFETKEQERVRLANEKETKEIEDGLYDDVYKRSIVEGFKEKGLQVLKEDSEEVASIKRSISYILSKESWFAFEANEENNKVRERARTYASRRERENAFREADGLVVRGRGAFESVWESPDVKGLRSAMRILLEQQAAKLTERGKRDPQVMATSPSGGSMAGKPPTTWDDAIAGH